MARGHLDFQICRGGGRRRLWLLGEEGEEKTFFPCFSLPPKPSPPLGSFDTHARWQPVTQSPRSRKSDRKIKDCEESRIWHLVLDRVVDMDVGCEANDSGSKRPSSVYLSCYFSDYTVQLDLSFSSRNFSERNNLASGDVT